MRELLDEVAFYCALGPEGDGGPDLDSPCDPATSSVDEFAEYVSNTACPSSTQRCVPNIVAEAPATLIVTSREIPLDERPECAPTPFDGCLIRLETQLRLEADDQTVLIDMPTDGTKFESGIFERDSSCQQGNPDGPGLYLAGWFPFSANECAINFSIGFSGAVIPDERNFPSYGSGFKSALLRFAQDRFDLAPSDVIPVAITSAGAPDNDVRRDGDPIPDPNDPAVLSGRYPVTIRFAQRVSPPGVILPSARITPRQPNENFAGEVALSGDVAVIASFPNRVQMFRYDGRAWREEASASGRAGREYRIPGDGSMVAVYGDWALVGAEDGDGGAVYVYRATDRWRLSDVWVQLSGEFGHAVAIDRDRAIVGDDEGKAYIYERSPGATYWNRRTTIEGNPSAYFGRTVAIEGDVAVVGAPYESPGGSVNEGAAYVYRRTEAASWEFETRLALPIPNPHDYLGSRVTIAGDRIFATSARDFGQVNVFRRVGSTWSLDSVLSGSLAVPEHERALFFDYGETRTPRLADFRLVRGSWARRLFLGLRDEPPPFHSTHAAVSRGRVLMGVRGEGAAYVFERPGVTRIRFEGTPPAGTMATLVLRDVELSVSFERAVDADQVARAFASQIGADDGLVRRGVTATAPGGGELWVFGVSPETASFAASSSAVHVAITNDCGNDDDDDGDGAIDLTDPGCADASDPSERSPGPCDNGIDDNGDGRRDYQENGAGDVGCSSPSDPSEHDECSDTVDNDGDGLVDGDDIGCDGDGDLSERSPAYACDDGLDNDGDGLIDAAADPGCPFPYSSPENPPCDNRVDDDGDGYTDFEDSFCSEAWPYWENWPCGIGAELALVLVGLQRVRRRRVRRSDTGTWAR